ncbi:Coenzyme F420 hydrogenase/dehydrogenase, beta subunit C-terminal domain [Bacteroides reticulotermitis]|uniref:Coenzyme F420 hydrogenase/dehydrogenase, beta subunit C-terminal domain n=1 Tax=Bacteroides reticulotermitis TaxID=1133319 RepID=UPI003A83A375
MITIKDKRECCGCSACASVCPKYCIIMSEDNEGFRYPIVDSAQCVDCGLCENVCPILNIEKESLFQQEAYLIQHKDGTILKQSTSGGAFTAISEWVIEQNGVIFGAAFKDNTFEVQHRFVENKEDLVLFRNSKYVQSCIADSYKLAQDFLRKGRWVCFSGTPCQIEGLVKFLRREYATLLLVDVVCRAVPSPLVLKKYIDFQSAVSGGKFTGLFFREKYYGYKYSTLSLYNVIPKLDYRSGVESNYYLRSFFSGMAIRPSCAQCVFKKQYRVSDITLWDCFDVYRFSKELDDDRGVTRALVHTAKGVEIIQKIQEYAKVLPIDVEKAVEGVKELKFSVQCNPKRGSFFRDLNSMQTDECFNKYFPITMRSKIEKIIRLAMNRLGMYSFAKRAFKTLFPKMSSIKK